MNNYQNAQIDYPGDKVTLNNLKNTLLNLNSSQNTNLLLYIVDHGGSFEIVKKPEELRVEI